jgi:prepilin-type N-terminal cleavage/methylation domain-containing protein
MNTRTSEFTTRGHKTDAEHGFTLVELLVSIAIVAVLAALLFAVGSNFVKRAQMTTNMNTMRQIGIALLAYTGEHDGRLPTSNLSQRPNMRDGHLAKPLAPYLGVKFEEGEDERKVNPLFADKAWVKAMGLSQAQLEGTGDLPTRFRLNRWTHNGMRNFPWGNPAQADKTEGYKLMMVPNPARVWALQDADRRIDSISTLEEPLWGKERLALFFDGHVESMSADSYWTGPTPPSK